MKQNSSLIIHFFDLLLQTRMLLSLMRLFLNF